MDNFRKIEIPQPGISTDKPIPGVYAVIDNDLALDNLQNDLTEADKQDLSALPEADGEDF